MRRSIPCLCLAAALLAPAAVQARVAQARIARMHTPVATLEQVQVRLDWAENADSGQLRIRAGRVDAPALGYHFRDLTWTCPLRRTPEDGWQCEGALRGDGAAALRLGIHFDVDALTATLAQGQARLALERRTATPDLTTLILTRVPLVWAQALLAQAWEGASFGKGTLDGRLAIVAPAAAPLRVSGPLRLHAAALQNADSSIVGEGLGGDFQLAYVGSAAARVTVAGVLHGGEFLVGSTYVALPPAPVGLHIEADSAGAEGWRLPRIEWRDGDVLAGSGRARLAPDGNVRELELQAHSGDLGPLAPRYLSGWLGVLGLSGVELRGGVDMTTRIEDGALVEVTAVVRDAGLHDPAGRFGFDGLRGDLRYSAEAPVDSQLQWTAGELYGLEFGAAAIPLRSGDGTLRSRAPWRVPMQGGSLTLSDVAIRPAREDAGADIRFGMALEGIDFGRVSKALGLPAFTGVLGGEIPSAHYANDRIDFDGGLTLHLFDGTVRFSELALERPFGTAPSLTADIALKGLDLARLTEVLGFGTITGRLDGSIEGLRLVDWTPVAFDARFASYPAPGVKQRISQRAVQDIGSVGDSSFMASLQGQLIGLFSDFGYRRLGIGCRLENQICTMSGLSGSAGAQDENAFTIVEGSGVPRLDVIGFNRAVDWTTLVQRLLAAGKGEVAPVIE
ncbi:hypothetical protein [Thermomonas sp.]|uniref:hypothetical protein n=1 Tax=Thermomonas sp. TaxID=1971895 RepID=UPI00262A4CA1|nr:hypothetical protein [Thermomonas sp.]MCO5054787.1 hypothetical protein [Thermomonas sp.]